MTDCNNFLTGGISENEYSANKMKLVENLKLFRKD